MLKFDNSNIIEKKRETAAFNAPQIDSNYSVENDNDENEFQEDE